MPKTAEYTATTPATQLTQERAPPGIGSFTIPSFRATARQPAERQNVGLVVQIQPFLKADPLAGLNFFGDGVNR